MPTEVDMRAPLFPKEQVPASTPNSPREVGTILLGILLGIFLGSSWDVGLFVVGTLAPLVSPDGDLDGGEASLTKSFMHTRGWCPSSVFGRGIVGSVATLGAVAAGAAIVEAALIPGLLIGGAAVLVPRLLPRDLLSGSGDRLRRTAPSPVPVPSAPTAHSPEAPASGEPESFDTWRAVVKTFTYRVMVTTVDFGANYFVIGELATAAGLSSLSLVAGPIAYFAHEAAWYYYGPASARHPNPLEATVHVPIPGAAAGAENGRTPFASVKVSRALAKTVTYEVVTGVGIWRQLSLRPRSRGRRRTHRLQHRDRPLCLLRA
jgi:uncharacterized membrane protein